MTKRIVEDMATRRLRDEDRVVVVGSLDDVYKRDPRPSAEVGSEITTHIVRCPSCGYRHGGEVAETEHISWRCKRCKLDNSGKVLEIDGFVTKI